MLFQLLLELRRRHLIDPPVQLLDGAELVEETHCGLIADAGHAGDIVRCVALERLEVRNLLRQDAVALLNLLCSLVDYGVALVGPVHP